MSNETPAVDVPVRRVSMIVTGYLRRGKAIGGFYDMQSQANGGQQYSIPEFEVDEASVKDAPPETLTADDWAEIHGTIAARYGAEAGALLVQRWMRIAAELDAQRGAS